MNQLIQNDKVLIVGYQLYSMNILLTGAFGNVGRSTLDELLSREKHRIQILDIDNPHNRRIAKKYKNQIELTLGDLRDRATVEYAVQNSDAVIHVAAIIPPLADKMPDLAYSVNVEGTKNIVNAISDKSDDTRLIFTSSIATYGDRRNTPIIKTTDPFKPGHDGYAKHKIECEKMITESSIPFTINRLTYIVSPSKIKMDPIMFHMPLETKIEICHTKDIGLALTNALETEDSIDKIFNLAGGESCRTDFEEYLNNMTEMFGLGRHFLPKSAFSTENFHCGWMDTEESQEVLRFQRHSLDDYFGEVKAKYQFVKPFASMVKNSVKKVLLKQSPFYLKSIQNPA